MILNSDLDLKTVVHCSVGSGVVVNDRICVFEGESPSDSWEYVNNVGTVGENDH